MPFETFKAHFIPVPLTEQFKKFAPDPKEGPPRLYLEQNDDGKAYAFVHVNESKGTSIYGRPTRLDALTRALGAVRTHQVVPLEGSPDLLAKQFLDEAKALLP